MPALLAVAAVHHHLIREGTRTKVGLILESGEPREVHHFALLIGYGAGAVNPYLAFETLDDLIRQGHLTGIDQDHAVKNYIKAINKGVLKVMSKMGISTAASYCGAQIFEAVGLHQEFIDQYFTSTPSRISGIGLDVIARDTINRTQRAYRPAFQQWPRARRGRPVPVSPRGRAAPVQPRNDSQPPGRGPQQQLPELQGVQRPGQRSLETNMHSSRSF